MRNRNLALLVFGLASACAGSPPPAETPPPVLREEKPAEVPPAPQPSAEEAPAPDRREELRVRVEAVRGTAADLAKLPNRDWGGQVSGIEDHERDLVRLAELVPAEGERALRLRDDLVRLRDAIEHGKRKQRQKALALLQRDLEE